MHDVSGVTVAAPICREMGLAASRRRAAAPPARRRATSERTRRRVVPPRHRAVAPARNPCRRRASSRRPVGAIIAIDPTSAEAAPSRGAEAVGAPPRWAVDGRDAATQRRCLLWPANGRRARGPELDAAGRRATARDSRGAAVPPRRSAQHSMGHAQIHRHRGYAMTEGFRGCQKRPSCASRWFSGWFNVFGSRIPRSNSRTSCYTIPESAQHPA
jgi:hypothetical protein